MEKIKYEALNKIVLDYKANFEKHRKEELYKWEAIKTFQDNWNIESKDFVEMLKKSLSNSYNLLNSNMYYPQKMIMDFAKKEPKKVKDMFVKLFDEKLSLLDRYNYFVKGAEEILSKYWPKGKHHYQDTHAISVYLMFMYPEKYYMYKASVDKKAASILGVEIFDKNKITTLNNYFDLCNDVLKYVSKDNELIRMHKKSLTHNCYSDDVLHVLTLDVLFYGGKYYSDTKYWLFAPGENAYLWDDCIKNGIMSLGWDEIGDLKQYKNEKEIYEKLKLVYKKENPKNDKCALNDFKNNMKVGDIVIVKKGIYEILGYGKVVSNYYFDESRKIYKHVRKVEWIKNGSWKIIDVPGERQLAQKTLTDLTRYGDYSMKLLSLMDEKEEVKEDINNEGNTNYFWLNANPKIWSFSELEIGEIIEYTAISENGYKRQVYKNYLSAKKGDIVIAYESYPSQMIVGLCVIDEDFGEDQILYVRKTETLINPIPYKDFSDAEELKNMEYIRHPQGSLFKIEEPEYEFLIDLIREYNPKENNKKSNKYKKANFLADVFIDSEKYDEMRDLLLTKKNIILQGVPGVGKTYMAKKLAYSIIESVDDEKVMCIQFHQNYSYEDFIEGYRPAENSFELQEGVFYRFCKMARNDLNNKYFFIIDEINRGNLSKIFGELLMLIEPDKRNEKLTLAYSKQKFSIPENVYVIGMMNTADRSLAIMDYALRRRFCFYDVEPIFDQVDFVKYIKSFNNKLLDITIENIKKLNDEIENDSSLGKGFQIGHSYFCKLNSDSIEQDLKMIIKYQILPMLEEYWFDDKKQYEKWKSILLGENND